MKRLPLGIQDFRKLREENLLYIDKTQDIYRLIQSGYYYFLSRPRRFGKSLLLSALQEIFLGNKELFQGLWIEDKIEWVKHPVVHISFNAIGYKDLGLERAIEERLGDVAVEYGIQLEKEGVAPKFDELLKKLNASSGKKVVLLIDEYDKPIVDYIDDLETADKQRDILKNFYSIVKNADRYIRFFFVTGVSKFSRVSLFSDLNNLEDITLLRKFATIAGYTEQEVERYFKDRIELTAETEKMSSTELRKKITSWYNGYSWDGRQRVYNPFSILSFFSAEQFQNFWWHTGTPSFLIKLLRKGMHYQLEKVRVGESIFESYTLDNLEFRSLLFQTGYLTIHSISKLNTYTLGYPNKEVRDSMYQHLLGAFREGSSVDSNPLVEHIIHALYSKDIAAFIKYIDILFETLPYQIFIKDRESFFHAILHIALHLMGMHIESEVSTANGRVDTIIHTDDYVYIIEFKLDQPVDNALTQIREQRYGSKYLGQNKEVLAIGISFSSEHKAVEEWKIVPYEKLLAEG